MRLSIILPARNAELFLERAFDSALALPDAELIVVPDGEDDTALVASELVGRTKRAAIAQTLEQAFERSTGAFVCCLEARAAFVQPQPLALMDALAETKAEAVVFQTRLEHHCAPERGSTFARRSWSGAFGVVTATDPVRLVNALGLAPRVDFRAEVISMRTTVSPRVPPPPFLEVADQSANLIAALLEGTSAADVRQALLDTEFARLGEALQHLDPGHQVSLVAALRPVLAAGPASLSERLQRQADLARLLFSSQLGWASRRIRGLVAKGGRRASRSSARRVLRRLVRPHPR